MTPFTEESYPGNIGVMEMMKFFSMATPEEKSELKSYLKNDDPESAWQLLQKVTGIKLHDIKFDKPVLAEGSDVLYHYTSVPAALSILQNDKINLSYVVPGHLEQNYSNGKSYFLSTSRSKVGDYHRYAGSSAVMFELDGRAISHNYMVKPVDYWERMWNHPGSERSRESEDRISTDKSNISLKYVTRIHLLITSEARDRIVSMARKLFVKCKQKNIMCYVYNDEQAWRLQQTGKSLKGQDLINAFNKSSTDINRYTNMSDLFQPWLELIFGNTNKELSKSAARKLYNIKYYGDGMNALSVDLQNSRKPNSPDYEDGRKIIEFMKSKNMSSFDDLKNYIASRWKKD